MKNKLIIGVMTVFFLVPGLSISCGNLDEVVYSGHPDYGDDIDYNSFSNCVTLKTLESDYTYNIVCSVNTNPGVNKASLLTELSHSASLLYGDVENISVSGDTQIILYGVHVNNTAGKGFIWDEPDALNFSNISTASFTINCHATDLEANKANNS
ncbi:MAG: hypothetical protein K0R24_1483 [Gammaproteobacteria bacterium]|jgi:hypothetical protein|nr:hypothetical protein [Gammaproteobacteria bacterium]